MIWDFKRFAIHIPIGMFQSWLTHKNATAGVLFALGFMFYEINEDWHLRDGAYIDIQGALAGEVLQALWEHRRKDSPEEAITDG